jgi:RND family efflux transporter MFP subunit
VAQLAPQLIQWDGQVKQATDQLRNAKILLDRAESLAREHLGGSAAVVDAKAQFDLAQTTLNNAKQNRDMIAKVTDDAAKGNFNAHAITAPATGVIQSLQAMPGQKVQAGAILFGVQMLDPVWVRVPIFVGDLAGLAIDRDAEIGGVADAPGAPTRRGKPVLAPPSGDPLTTTVNIFYEVDNKDSRLRTGQRVGATLPMEGADESLTVPRASLLRDVHGNAWVYEKTGDHAYSRRLVMVDRVVGDLAVLASGKLKPGVKVVTDGAAELFGAEFGGFK